MDQLYTKIHKSKSKAEAAQDGFVGVEGVGCAISWVSLTSVTQRFNGRNHTELMREFGISRRLLYAILARRRGSGA